jgi:hypothetical protein
MARTNVGLLYCKVESVAGTDVIAGSLSGLKPVFALSPAVYDAEGEEIPRMVLDGGSSPIASDIKLLRGKISFSMELRGNYTNGVTADQSKGAATYEPESHNLLQACDLVASYTPESTLNARDGYITYSAAKLVDQGVTLTLYLYYAKKLHKLTGCKGTVSFSVQVGDYVRAQFEFQGIHRAVTDAETLPTVTNADFPALKPEKFINTIAGVTTSFFRLGGIDLCISSFTVNVANQITMRHCPAATNGMYGMSIVDRTITGEIDPEDAQEAARPDWAGWAAASLSNVALQVSMVAGNMISLHMNSQISSLRYDSRNGLIVKRVGLRCIRYIPGDTDISAFYIRFG